MKGTIITCVLSLSMLYCFSQSSAPSVVNTCGGNWKAGYYQFEWSVGELALIDEMNSQDKHLIVTNGFLQPYTHNPAGINKSLSFDNDELRIFPNPASDYVEINLLTKRIGKVYVHFYDAAGQKVYSSEIQYYGLGSIQRIPVNMLANGTYMLEIQLTTDDGFINKKGMYKLLKLK